MTRWQRHAIVATTLEEGRKLKKLVEKGLGGVLTAVLQKVLGY